MSRRRTPRQIERATAEGFGQRVLHDNAMPELAAGAAQLVHEGNARWVWDPEVDGVAGLLSCETGRALVIVYPDGDFESGVELDELLENAVG